MSAPRGVALINALIIVAAVAALATALLVRAERARTRLAAHATADQAQLYLDAAAPLIAAALTRAPDAPARDHPDDDWASPRTGEAIDRGTIDWRIADLQGRFNVNWLADAEGWGEPLRAAFERLARARDIAPELATRLAVALDPGAAGRAQAWQHTAPPEGPLIDVRELRAVGGMSDDAMDRLAPVLAALPVTTAINVNTVQPEVLGAFLEGVAPETVQELLEARLARPFVDVTGFRRRVLEPVGADEALLPERLAVGSDWFVARLAVRLDTQRHARTLVLHRAGAEGAVTVHLSLPEYE